MVIKLDIRHNIDEVIRSLNSNRTDQLPFATALALTRTVQRVRDAQVERMSQVFDRPTPFTLNALYVVPATKTRLVASVGIKDFASKGTPADRYLRPQIEGGTRNLKRSERALQARGLMPAGWYAVPGAGAQIDQYGNMRASQIVAILSALQALPGAASAVPGYVKRAARGKYARRRYFVAKPGGHLKPGVYERLSKGVRPVLLFVPRLSYRQRWDFYGEGRKLAIDYFKSEFTIAWRQALATAR